MTTYGANDDEDAPHSFPSSAILLSSTITATTQKMPGSLEKMHTTPTFLLSLGSMYFLFYFNWKTPHQAMPPFPITFNSRFSFLFASPPFPLDSLSLVHPSHPYDMLQKNSFPILCVYCCLKMYT